MLGSAEEAAQAFSDLKILGAKTPFNVEGLTAAAIQLKQTGTAMSEMNDMLTMLGDTAGGSNDKFNRIVANFAQIQSVGKTTAMDLRQFAMMGLPIYDTLRKMGVQGNATAEQIKTAFKMMTSEGSAYYNGMAIGATTLAGRTSTLSDTWKEYKATFAEVTGLGAIWKKFVEDLSAQIQTQTDKLNEQKKVKEALEAAKNGSATEDQSIIVLNQQIDSLIAKRKQAEGVGLKRGMFFSGEIEDIQKLTNEIEALRQKVLDLEQAKKGKDVKVAAAKKLKEEVEAEAKIYTDAMTEINAAYDDTKDAKVKGIEEQIQKYQEYVNLRRRELVKDKNGNESYEYFDISEEDKNKIQIVIASLEKQLESLKEKAEDTKVSLTGWQQVLKDVFNFSDTDFEAGFLKTGVTAVDEYLRRIELAKKAQLEITGLINGDNTADLSNNASILSEIEGKLRSSYIAALSSGEWTGTEESILKLRNAWLKAKEAADSAQKTERSAATIADLEKQYLLLLDQSRLMGKTADERQRAKFLSEGMTEEEAALAIQYQKEIEYLQVQNDLMGQILLKKKEAAEAGNLKDYAKYTAQESALSAVSGSNVGTFIETATTTGSWKMALLDTLIASLFDVIGGMEGMSLILNPINDILQEFEPLFKSALLIVVLVLKGLTALSEGVMWLLDTITGGLFTEMSDMYDLMVESNDEKQTEIDRLKTLNEQYSDLTSAMKDQSEYYLSQKQALLALFQNQDVSATKVNDMVITSDGKKFITDRADSIIATKYPESLGGSGTAVYVSIKNEAGDVTTATAVETQNANGMKEVLVTISKKIASDYANGENGWDNASLYRTKRLGGRSSSV